MGVTLSIINDLGGVKVINPYIRNKMTIKLKSPDTPIEISQKPHLKFYDSNRFQFLVCIGRPNKKSIFWKSFHFFCECYIIGFGANATMSQSYVPKQCKFYNINQFQFWCVYADRTNSPEFRGAVIVLWMLRLWTRRKRHHAIQILQKGVNFMILISVNFGVYILPEQQVSGLEELQMFFAYTLHHRTWCKIHHATFICA